METYNTINVIDMTGNEPKQFTFKMPKLPEWTMAKEIGYEPKTTFWQDFSIADIYGAEAVLDTFKQAFREWHHDVTYIAELALVLNHKGCWFYAASEQRGGDEILDMISQMYFKMYEQLHDWAHENFTGDDAEYYFKVTD